MYKCVLHTENNKDVVRDVLHRASTVYGCNVEETTDGSVFIVTSNMAYNIIKTISIITAVDSCSINADTVTLLCEGKGYDYRVKSDKLYNELHVFALVDKFCKLESEVQIVSVNAIDDFVIRIKPPRKSVDYLGIVSINRIKDSKYTATLEINPDKESLLFLQTIDKINSNSVSYKLTGDECKVRVKDLYDLEKIILLKTVRLKSIEVSGKNSNSYTVLSIPEIKWYNSNFCTIYGWLLDTYKDITSIVRSRGDIIVWFAKGVDASVVAAIQGLVV